MRGDVSKYKGKTPVHTAVTMGNLEAVRLLVLAGANVNAKDRHKKTPLHLAVYCINLEVVRLFVPKGGDVHAKDHED